MNLFSLLIGCAAGLFAVAHAIALASVFDYYFFLFPFGLALVGYALAAGLLRTPLLAPMDGKLRRASPVLAGLAMLASAGVYRFGPSMAGASFFVWSLFALQMVAHALAALALLRDGRPVASVCGIAAGLALGYGFVAYLNADPLLAVLAASLLLMALPFGRLFGKAAPVAYGLMAGLAGYACYLGVQQQVMPASLGWRVDPGKLGPSVVGEPKPVKRIWGRAGVSELYALDPDERGAWMFVNGTTPSLVLIGAPARYGDDWWMQKAPLTLALHDAVQPVSVVDVGMAPSDVAWRALGRGGKTHVQGVYASHDWTRLPLPGFEELSRKIELARQDGLAEPVDMVVVTSGHAGQGGWISSNRGEQTFLAREDILLYWKALHADGALVFLARQETVFLKQLFSAWGALNRAGLSDADFRDRAWALVPEARSGHSPYQFALVLTKQAKDPRFAQAMKAQVLKLPVKYLFGAGLPPSSPYHVLYQADREAAQAIFTRAASQLYRKQLTLEAFDSFRATPYRFSPEVPPQYKALLVLAVGALLGIILLPLQSYRQVEAMRTMQQPGVAVWLAAGGALGASLVLAAAFLLIFPSGLVQEWALGILAVALVAVMTVRGIARGQALTMRIPLLSALAVGLALLLSWASGAADIARGDSLFYVVSAAGLVFVGGLVLSQMHCAIRHEPIIGLASWLWFAAAAGGVVALFWSVRLYSIVGSGLLFAAFMLWAGAVAVFAWHARATVHPAAGDASHGCIE